MARDRARLGCPRAGVQGPGARPPSPRERFRGAREPVSDRVLPYQAQTAQGRTWGAPVAASRQGADEHGFS